MVASDWAQSPSIAPDDGGTFRHFLTRTFIDPSSASAPSMIVANPAGRLIDDFPTIYTGRDLKSYYASGNQTANTGALTVRGTWSERAVPESVPT